MIVIELSQSGGPNPYEAQRVESLLSRQLTAAGEILASCFEVSRGFVPDTSRFHPVALPNALPSILTARSRPGFARSMIWRLRDLYYGTDEPPTFDDVLQRVQAGCDVLDIEAIA